MPGWLGLGRDFTERWVHQQQIREAVGKLGSHDRFLPVVLSIFVWAFPHQYQPQAEEGAAVNIDFGRDTRWHLIRGERGWELKDRLADSPAAAIITDMDTAWRQLTGAPITPGAVTTEGPLHLVGPLLEVRGIIV